MFSPFQCAVFKRPTAPEGGAPPDQQAVRVISFRGREARGLSLATTQDANGRRSVTFPRNTRVRKHRASTGELPPLSPPTEPAR